MKLHGVRGGCINLNTGAENDFLPSKQAIIITANATRGDLFCVDLSRIVLDDEILEYTENFTVVIDSIEPCGSVNPAEQETYVFITDNDS